MSLSFIIQMPHNVATTNTTSKTRNGMVAGTHTASQMAQPTYHHSPLMKSARPEHEPIPKTTKPNLITPCKRPWMEETKIMKKCSDRSPT